MITITSETDNSNEKYAFNYSDIQSFFLSSGSAKTCTIQLYFLNDTSLKLVLYTDKPGLIDNQDIVGFRIFKKLSLLASHMTVYKPFFITQTGNRALITLVALFVTNIGLHLMLDLSRQSFVNSGITSLSMVLIVVGTRTKQLSFYKAMSAILDKKAAD